MTQTEKYLRELAALTGSDYVYVGFADEFADSVTVADGTGQRVGQGATIEATIADWKARHGGS